MAEATVLFARTKAQIAGITLDCSIREQHTFEVEVTDHPIETGVNIADHIRPKPEMVTLEGLVSNTPMPGPNDSSTKRTIPVDNGQGETRGQVTYDSRAAIDTTRAKKAFDELRRLKDAGELVTLVTKLHTYENMAITLLDVPQDISIGEALAFTITLKQVRQVELGRTTVTPARSVRPSAKGEGAKATKPTPPQTKKSIAAAAVDMGMAVLPDNLTSTAKDVVNSFMGR